MVDYDLDQANSSALNDAGHKVAARQKDGCERLNFRSQTPGAAAAFGLEPTGSPVRGLGGLQLLLTRNRPLSEIRRRGCFAIVE